MVPWPMDISRTPASGLTGSAADLREGAVEESMCIEIAGRAQGAFDDFAVDVRNDQIGGGERCVVDTTWLDDD